MYLAKNNPLQYGPGVPHHTGIFHACARVEKLNLPVPVCMCLTASGIFHAHANNMNNLIYKISEDLKQM